MAEGLWVFGGGKGRHKKGERTATDFLEHLERGQSNLSSTRVCADSAFHQQAFFVTTCPPSDMPAPSQRTERRPEGEDRGVLEREIPSEQAQSTQGDISTASDRSDFHPPRSRTPTSSRHASSDTTRTGPHETQPTSRNPTERARWPQRSPQRSPRRYEGDAGSMPDIFSPPRSGKVRDFSPINRNCGTFKPCLGRTWPAEALLFVSWNIFFSKWQLTKYFSPFTFSHHLPHRISRHRHFFAPRATIRCQLLKLLYSFLLFSGRCLSTLCFSLAPGTCNLCNGYHDHLTNGFF